MFSNLVSLHVTDFCGFFQDQLGNQCPHYFSLTRSVCLPACMRVCLFVFQAEDLHRHFIDGITIPSSMGKGELRRVDDVFDCWFESGSMPYGQVRASTVLDSQ